jgi:hypothetical protein
MTTSKTVRALTIAFVLFHVVTSLVIPQLQILQDENVGRLLQYAGYGGILNASSPVFYVLPGVPLIASVGVYWFRNWGRVLLLIAVVLNLAGALAFGVSVSDPIGSFFAYLTVLCSGALLGIAFLSPARELFGSREGR